MEPPGGHILEKYNLTMHEVMEEGLRVWDTEYPTIFSNSSAAEDSEAGIMLGIEDVNLGSNFQIGVCNSKRGDLIMNFENKADARRRNINRNSFFPGT